jgi:hypothetical protein
VIANGSNLTTDNRQLTTDNRSYEFRMMNGNRAGVASGAELCPEPHIPFPEPEPRIPSKPRFVPHRQQKAAGLNPRSALGLEV